MEATLPKTMRLHLEGDREKKLLKLSDETGLSVSVLATRFVEAALAAVPDNHLTFPIAFEVKPPRKG